MEIVLDGEAGLRELREFAIQRNKPEAYPEWGCSTSTGAQGGGDNPAFVENMAVWLAGRPGKVLYQGYWNTGGSGPNAAIFASTVLVPDAAAAHLRLFSFPKAPGAVAATAR